ncbi:hypothetical protein EV361DRAFT_162374 [Lentinula raphanica]|nr:hypothetical protein EV361DRAFT_162374 [Lentinula raphanica]
MEQKLIISSLEFSSRNPFGYLVPLCLPPPSNLHPVPQPLLSPSRDVYSTPSRNMANMISRLHPQLRAMSDDTGATTPNSTGGETRTFAQSGSLGHRLIGVLIVLSLLVLAFVLWLLLAKRPRRKLRSWGCTCLPAPPERTAEGEEKYAENRNGDDHNVNRPETVVSSPKAYIGRGRNERRRCQEELATMISGSISLVLQQIAYLSVVSWTSTCGPES